MSEQIFIFFYNYPVLQKNPLANLLQTPCDPDLGRDPRLGTTGLAPIIDC
jgi:hypothetical protein